jgi:hypothetical protein
MTGRFVQEGVNMKKSAVILIEHANRLILCPMETALSILKCLTGAQQYYIRPITEAEHHSV